MRKNSIVFKLFWITFGIFGIFIIIVMVFQSIFFNKLYLNKKINNTTININKFANEYKKSNWDTKQALNQFDKFAKENNTFILVMDEKGNIKLRDEYGKYKMTIKDNSGNEYEVNLENIMYVDAFSEFIPHVGDQIYVEGIIKNNKTSELEPYKVKKAGTEYFDESILKKYRSTYIEETTLIMKEIQGQITFIDDSFKNRGYDFYKRSLLWNKAYKYWLNNNTSKIPKEYDQIEYNIYKEPNSEIQEVMFIKHIKKDYVEELIFVITSLQPISEAANVMNDYVVYVVLLALVFISILSFIYSKIISKPLIEMNKTANKMAKLNFSIRSNINSKDELGSLSNSLNILSNNLSSSMKELNEVNKKLQDDIEKERAQEQVRKEFVANVSHELKTPLGIIKGFAEGIKDGIYIEKKDYYIDIIVDEIEKTDKMIIEMMELTKLESKSYKLIKSELDLQDMIFNVTKKFQYQIQEKNICVNYDIKRYIVFADNSKIEQVIVNLVSNAIRYTQNNKQIYIRTECREDKVYVYFENNTEPILDKDLKKIWDRFYRVDKSRSRALGGTGLGLSIVKNILELHGSEYGVRNTKKGVEFYFALNKNE